MSGRARCAQRPGPPSTHIKGGPSPTASHSTIRPSSSVRISASGYSATDTEPGYAALQIEPSPRRPTVRSKIKTAQASPVLAARRLARVGAESVQPRLAQGLRSADHEHLLPEGAVEVGPGRAAGAHRGARHRGDSSAPALVEGRGAGLGAITGARVLGEFGDDPHRYASAKNRRNDAGTSPITRAPGKRT